MAKDDYSGPSWATKQNFNKTKSAAPFKAASAKSAPPKPRAKPESVKAKAAPPKPRAKPESVKAKGYVRTADNAGGPRKGSVSTGKSSMRVGSASSAKSGKGPAMMKGGGSTTISKTPAKNEVARSGASRSTAGKVAGKRDKHAEYMANIRESVPSLIKK